MYRTVEVTEEVLSEGSSLGSLREGPPSSGFVEGHKQYPSIIKTPRISHSLHEMQKNSHKRWVYQKISHITFIAGSRWSTWSLLQRLLHCFLCLNTHLWEDEKHIEIRHCRLDTVIYHKWCSNNFPSQQTKRFPWNKSIFKLRRSQRDYCYLQLKQSNRGQNHFSEDETNRESEQLHSNLSLTQSPLTQLRPAESGDSVQGRKQQKAPSKTHGTIRAEDIKRTPGGVGGGGRQFTVVSGEEPTRECLVQQIRYRHKITLNRTFEPPW